MVIIGLIIHRCRKCRNKTLMLLKLLAIYAKFSKYTDFTKWNYRKENFPQLVRRTKTEKTVVS